MYIYIATQTRERNMLKALKKLLNGRLPGRWHFLTVLVLGSTSAIVSAGEYVVSMSGGTADGVPYIGTSGTRGYTPPMFIQNSPLNINYSGTITTTFQWATDDPISDPAPDQVIVVEESNVRLDASIYGQGLFVIADGFGQTKTLTNWGGIQLNTTRATVVGGSSFTITCEPKITGTCNAFGNLSPSLTYSATLVYPKITLGLTKLLNGKNTTAVGHEVQGTVTMSSSVYPASINGNVTWDVGNTDAIKDFEVGPNQSYGKIIDFNASAGENVSWFYFKGPIITSSDPKSQRVTAVVAYTCMGASATTKAGCALLVYGPKAPSTVNPNTGLGNYSILSDSMVTDTSKHPAAAAAVSMDFSGWSNPQGWSGEPQWTQLVNLYAHLESNPFGGLMNVRTTNGEYWLDNTYPYSRMAFSDSPEQSFNANFVRKSLYNFKAYCYPQWTPNPLYGAKTIKVATGKFYWAWWQQNTPTWGAPIGAPACSPFAPSFQRPVTWDTVFHN